MMKKQIPDSIEACDAEIEQTEQKIRQLENQSKMIDRRLAIEKRQE
ncbi:hypothetical protein HCH52_12120 [Oscillospiraceae bacterium HV4-5-C5C]|nr:hypothetical protein [Oscillospiraceae bacterium HV4-5-C5C]